MLIMMSFLYRVLRMLGLVAWMAVRWFWSEC